MSGLEENTLNSNINLYLHVANMFSTPVSAEEQDRESCCVLNKHKNQR